MHCVRGVPLAVISDDRRMLIEVAEVETATALPLDVDLISFLADSGANGVADGSWLFDLDGYFASLLYDLEAAVCREARHLIRHRLALCLVGVENRWCRPTAEGASNQPG